MAGSDSVLRSPASMLRAASVAIVGASERARWASQIFGNLRQNGYGGKIHLVNPRQQTVYGERCFPSLRDIGEPVDHAMVIVPAANVADVLTDAEAAGVKSATIYASAVGDGESEPSTAARRLAQGFSRHRQIARQRPELHGLLQLPRKAVRLSQHRIVQSAARLGRRDFPVRRHHAVLAEKRVRPRLALFLLRLVRQRNRSRSRRLSQFRGRRSAHQADRAVHRRHPPAAGLHARRRPRARSRQADPGDQDRRHAEIAHAARSHTGAIAGDYAAYLAMCERYGIVNCRSLDDLVECTLAFQCGRLPKGPRIGFVTTSGGTVDLLYDYAETEGAVVPEFSAATKAALMPHDAGRHCAEKSARRRHSIDAQGRRRQCAIVAARSQHRHGRLGLAAAGQGRRVGRRDAASPAVERDRQAGDGVRPHDPPGDASRDSTSRKRPAFRSCRVSSRRCAPSTRCGSTPQRRGRAPAIAAPRRQAT